MKYPKAGDLQRATSIDLTDNPPFVLPVPGQKIRSWDHGHGTLEKICEKGVDGSYTAYLKLADGRRVSVPLTRTEYDFGPRKALEQRTGFSTRAVNRISRAFFIGKNSARYANGIR